MRKIYFIIIVTLSTTLAFLSCTDYLDIVPDNVATIDYAFYDRVGAEKFLATCYSYLPLFGSPGNDVAIQGSDEICIHREEPVYWHFNNFNTYRVIRGQQNVSSPLANYWDGGNSGHNLFQAIRDCNIFLDNIDKVGNDLDEWEKIVWIGEVKFLKAYYHYFLARMYGPIPIIRENLPLSAGIEEVRVYRDPFDDVIDYIVELLDEAIEVLPLNVTSRSTQLGRITKPIAAAIKAEVLVMAASPLFNGNTTYAGFTDSRGISLFNTTFESEKWKRAMEAGKEAINIAQEGQHELYVFNDPNYKVSETTQIVQSCRGAFTDRWNKEVIWGLTKNTMHELQRMSIPYFTLKDVQYITSTICYSPTLRMAELFYSANGVPIEEDISYDYLNRHMTSFADEDQKYFVTNRIETANLNQNREARFYANLGFDGGVWYGNGKYKDIDMGEPSETSWVISAKRGEPSGKTQAIRYSATGYMAKKYSHFQTASAESGSLVRVRMVFPIIRLADLYLLYAEARNEYSGPDEEVYYYLDLVRKRAGLEGVVKSWAQHSKYPNKPLNKEGLRNIIRQERMIELAFEGKRFWDIRRWKTANQLLNSPIKGWNVEGSTTIDYYNIVTLERLKFQVKEYLWPISESSLRTNTNLIQNPFWNE